MPVKDGLKIEWWKCVCNNTQSKIGRKNFIGKLKWRDLHGPVVLQLSNLPQVQQAQAISALCAVAWWRRECSKRRVATAVGPSWHRRIPIYFLVFWRLSRKAWEPCFNSLKTTAHLYNITKKVENHSQIGIVEPGEWNGCLEVGVEALILQMYHDLEELWIILRESL